MSIVPQYSTRLVARLLVVYNTAMEDTAFTADIAAIKAWLKTGSLNLFGLPFAGKDTHCHRLAELLDGVVIGGGDILRSQESPAHVRTHIDTGALAPTEEYLRIVLPYLAQEKLKPHPLILSSVGRWHGEEAGVLEATAQAGHPLLAVIYLNITEDEMHRRQAASGELQDRGERNDDAAHILDKRVAEFHNKTMPVIDFYKGQDMLITIDGMHPREAVHATIIAELAKRARSYAP